MKELVSICLLTYMHEDYIGDAIMGLLDQTYSNLELIILDDHSSDGTCEKINEFMQKLKEKFSKVELIINECNTGNIPRNCNTLISKASGDYIKLIAGDDIMLPNCIDELVEQFINHPDADVIHGDAFVENDSYHYGNDYSWKLVHDRDEGFERDDFHLYMMYGSRILAPTAIVRAGVYKEYGYYDENIGYEDYDFWLRLLEKGVKYYYVNKPLVIYRRTAGSVTDRTKGDIEKKLEFAIRAEIATKIKHIECLDEKKRIEIWDNVYIKFRQECEEIGSEKCRIILDELLQDSASRIDYVSPRKQLSTDKLLVESRALEEWIFRKESMDCFVDSLVSSGKKVSIYGYARLGHVLFEEISSRGGKVDVIIDQSGKNLYSYAPIVCLDELDDVILDYVVITVMNGYSEIMKELLRRFPNSTCVSLMSVIYGMTDAEVMK